MNRRFQFMGASIKSRDNDGKFPYSSYTTVLKKYGGGCE